MYCSVKVCMHIKSFSDVTINLHYDITTEKWEPDLFRYCTTKTLAVAAADAPLLLLLEPFPPQQQ